MLVVYHTRERKAGPQVPVTVVQCRTHRRAFTLYPLGHSPYGRLAVAPVTLDGQVVLSTRSEPTAGDRRSPAWRATQLGAAFAAIDDPTRSRSIYRWLAEESRDEPAGPEPVSPAPVISRALPAALIDFLAAEEACDRYASVPELIRRALQLGVIGPHQRIDRTSV